MSRNSAEDILSQLAGRGEDSDSDSWDAIVATQPELDDEVEAGQRDAKLEELIDRINNIDPVPPVFTESHAKDPPGVANIPKASVSTDSNSTNLNEFLPEEPRSFREAHLSASEVEAILLKLLLNCGDIAGRDIAEHISLPFALVEELLNLLKSDRLVAHRAGAAMNDFVYQLTDNGRERARRYSQQCTYFGSAPVSLKSYIQSVEAQSLRHQNPSAENLKDAFSDLLINPRMLDRLGPAINSGRGLFLFGAPGNGKTSIAERVTKAFGETIWIPKALGIDGEIIRLFDPSNHEIAPLAESSGLLKSHKIDHRWVRIRRPTIVVGGELTMEQLEITLNATTRINEAPFQLKSNCGTLVIDDFGRQRMSTDELLNRWIVPLEKRYDYLNLASGKKIQVPFDQLIVFSTNLEPKDLVDDAFLRRIPYKIEVTDPSDEDFRQLFRIMAKSLEIEFCDEVLGYLIDTHYKRVNRPFRACQPRDLLTQIVNYCNYRNETPEMTNDYMDRAIENYFAIM